ncbi:metallo-beta-lactamase superfamily protein [gamma proteobacterium HTCC5015]|nr:metallo-beta-lactamase superfamily protein [gamma proteobacterium HTCC5015]
MLLDDGETQLLTDGFFTRPSLLSLLGEISPDRQVVEDALLQYGINETLAAVIPVHSHHDHALDSALVAQLTGATLLGSESSAMLARGEGLDKRQIRVAETKQPYQFGNFSVTLIESGHVPMPNAIAGWIGLGEDIEKPVSPPAKLGDYHQGIAYSVLIEHPEARLLIQGSAGFKTDQFTHFQPDGPVDIVLLGIAGLSKQSDDYRAQYWREMVETIGAITIAPIHWDDFTQPLSADLIALPSLVDDLSATLEDIQAALKPEQSMLYMQPTQRHSIKDLLSPTKQAPTSNTSQ